MVDTVHYSRKMSDGNYGNLELGMHAQVDLDESPEQAAADLRAIVEGVLGHQREQQAQSEEAERHLYDLQMQIDHKQREWERMQGQWAQAKAFLEQHGVDTGRYRDNPF